MTTDSTRAVGSLSGVSADMDILEVMQGALTGPGVLPWSWLCLKSTSINQVFIQV